MNSHKHAPGALAPRGHNQRCSRSPSPTLIRAYAHQVKTPTSVLTTRKLVAQFHASRVGGTPVGNSYVRCQGPSNNYPSPAARAAGFFRVGVHRAGGEDFRRRLIRLVWDFRSQELNLNARSFFSGSPKRGWSVRFAHVRWTLPIAKPPFSTLQEDARRPRSPTVRLPRTGWGPAQISKLQSQRL
jgi:hypothetical protein